MSTTTLSSAGRVVVGTDASEAAHVAIDWAAAYAAGRSLPLTIVLVVPDFPMPRRLSVLHLATAGKDFGATVEAQAEAQLARRRKAILTVHPDLDVQTVVVAGEAAEVLTRATRDAALVVVGARGQYAPVKVRVLGGTSDAIVTHAEGLVVVVPESAHPHADGPVVVGVDEGADDEVSIELALAEAEIRGVPLVAVHAWIDDPLILGAASMGAPVVLEYEDAITSRLEASLEEMLAPEVASHPGVEVERKILRGRAGDVLIDESRGASLLVMGCRGRGAFASLLLGSTSREVLREAECPVLITRR